MKPKFRIGDRVRTIGLGDEWIVAGIDPLDTRRVYVSFDYNGTIAINEQPWYLEHELELVGCGIPAPVLRWEEVCGMLYGYIFQHRFRITFSKGTYVPYLASQPVGSFYETLGDAKSACQAYWQQLWDKEMLISRDLPETGE